MNTMYFWKPEAGRPQDSNLNVSITTPSAQGSSIMSLNSLDIIKNSRSIPISNLIPRIHS
jgi:hypothetical protein